MYSYAITAISAWKISGWNTLHHHGPSFQGSCPGMVGGTARVAMAEVRGRPKNVGTSKKSDSCWSQMCFLKIMFFYIVVLLTELKVGLH
jgi:hypothetical protein